jgi:hypothetical protein
MAKGLLVGVLIALSVLALIRAKNPRRLIRRRN